MEQIFKLPINSILREKDNISISHHYEYYSGKECTIYISHIRANGQHYLYVSINDNINNKHKEFKIRSITPNSLQQLEERINNHITQLGITSKFLNSWQKLIDDQKQHLENEFVVEINGDEVTTKSGNKHTLYFWQEDKTIEEINNRFLENYNKAVNSYEEYIKYDDE